MSLEVTLNFWKKKLSIWSQSYRNDHKAGGVSDVHSDLCTKLYFFFSRFVFCVVVIIFLGALVRPVQAALDPIEHSVTVTATIPSQSPPPVPILIRPENNIYIQDPLVEFRWYDVTGHSVGLTRYELVLDGVSYVPTIPLSNTETANYSLRVENGIFILKLKGPLALPDGQYTWKIVVHDMEGKDTGSATWVFRLDTQAPPLLITQIQNQTVSISASDPQTIPATPIRVTTSQPSIQGTSEPLAKIQLVVDRADGSQQKFQTVADESGRFSFTLPGLSPQEIVTLTFSAIDASGNTRSLTGLKVQYIPRKIVVPIPEIFPGQPTPPEIVIPIPDLPGILQPRPTPTPTPSSTLQPVIFPELVPEEPEPGQEVFERPVTNLGWWRFTLLMMLWGYTILLFWLSSGYWRWYLPWLLRALLPWWVLWPVGKDVVRTPRGNGIPWMPIDIEWLDVQQKLQRRRIWTSSGGWFTLPKNFPVIASLTWIHPRWEWLAVPQDRVTPSGWTPVRNLTLAQSSRVNEASSGQQTVLGSEPLMFWALAAKKSGWRARWGWLPRLWLLLMVACAVFLAWRVPVVETFILLALFGWILGRDLQSGLTKVWKAWEEESL